MPKLTFYGHSDDIMMFDIDGKAEDEIYSPYAVRLLQDEDCGIIIRGFYGRGGTWCVGIQPVGQDIRLPGLWNISVKLSDNGYSTALTVDIPLGDSWYYRKGMD